jgi:hypothetical protein
MRKKIIWIVVAVIILILILGIGAAAYVGWRHISDAWGNAKWYAVYLDTGDLYFGHLSHDDSLTLSDVWYVQHSTQGDPSINDFSKVSWKPEGTIKINREHIVWTAPIASDSPLLSAMHSLEASGADSYSGPAINSLPLVPATNGGAAASSASSAPAVAH